jgi:hypothetical protein
LTFGGRHVPVVAVVVVVVAHGCIVLVEIRRGREGGQGGVGRGCFFVCA